MAAFVQVPIVQGIIKDGTGASYSVDNAASLPLSSAGLGPPKFTDPLEQRQYLKGRLALAFIIFAKLGVNEGVAGNITIRDPVEPMRFWVNLSGVAWPLLKAFHLTRVNSEGRIVEGGPVKLLNTTAYLIHHAYYQARLDVNCVAHSHTVHGRVFSTLGRPLDIISQDSCAFYNDLAFYDSFGGVVLGDDEGRDIAARLGKKKAAILANHGLLTTGQSIEVAVSWFMSLETCCRVQLLADAAAAGRGGEKEAAFTYATVGTELAGWFSAKPTFDLMAREAGKEYTL